ncbi:MAG: phosphoribosylaminoimidazolesuccinocarboxamide synthase [Candidatus Methylacidiphilales bacterium]
MNPTLLHQGKVRGVYAWGSDLLLVASDRISAFDVILPDPIPGKGIALTQISRFWFERLPPDLPHHVIAFDLPPGLDRPDWEGRTTWCRRAQPFPLECIVRGYLAGSAWAEYQRTGSVQGIPLPSGLRESEQLPKPIFTPTTKAAAGHDQPLTETQARALVGDDAFDQLRSLSLRLYTDGAAYAASRGIIIADTKFEFGRINHDIILIDELLTPDSSRFWPLDGYQPGRSQPSYDKQFVRDYLLSLKDWNRQPPGPRLPADIIRGTQERYEAARRLLTGV